MKTSIAAIALLACVGLVASAQAGGDVQAGKAKAGECAGCHGANGEGNGGGPALAGKSVQALVQAMNEYKSGKRNNPVMKPFAVKLSDHEIADVAAYYASMKGK